MLTELLDSFSNVQSIHKLHDKIIILSTNDLQSLDLFEEIQIHKTGSNGPTPNQFNFINFDTGLITSNTENEDRQIDIWSVNDPDFIPFIALPINSNEHETKVLLT